MLLDKCNDLCAVTRRHKQVPLPLTQVQPYNDRLAAGTASAPCSVSGTGARAGEAVSAAEVNLLARQEPVFFLPTTKVSTPGPILPGFIAVWGDRRPASHVEEGMIAADECSKAGRYGRRKGM